MNSSPLPKEKIIIVRLEIEIEVLFNQLTALESDLKKIPLSRVLEIWSPETEASRIMFKLLDVKKREETKQVGQKNQETKEKISPTSHRKVYKRRVPSNPETYDPGQGGGIGV